MKISRRSFMSGLHATFLTTALASIVPSAYAMESPGMDSLDVLVSMHYFLSAPDNGTILWPKESVIAEIIPLYDEFGNIVAYYGKLENGGYAIVNNNIKTPTVIEFGEDDNPLIRKILNESPTTHIVYGGPFSVNDSDFSVFSSESQGMMDLYSQYPELQDDNEPLASAILEQCSEIRKRYPAFPTGDGDYGFIEWDDMPSGGYSEKRLPVSGVQWVQMNDYNDIAHDHCGATAATNLAMYFSNQGYFDLEKGSARDTFIAVHNIVGNGPIFELSGKVEKYFSSCGYNLSCSSVAVLDTLKDALDYDHPCDLLLADSIIAWHWILAFGYRDYYSGDFYIQIMDEWNKNIKRFYKLNSGSAWLSATEYWM